MMRCYWVVGGEYEDTAFEAIADGKKEMRLGPFDNYDQALEEWQKMAWETVDNALCHFHIEQEDLNGEGAEKMRLSYRLLTGNDDRNFCERVSSALDAGYVLYGQPLVHSHEGKIFIAQAVIIPVQGHVIPDTGTPDTGTPDTGTPDTGTSNTGTSDTGTSDTGTSNTGTEIC